MSRGGGRRAGEADMRTIKGQLSKLERGARAAGQRCPDCPPSGPTVFVEVDPDGNLLSGEYPPRCARCGGPHGDGIRVIELVVLVVPPCGPGALPRGATEVVRLGEGQLVAGRRPACGRIPGRVEGEPSRSGSESLGTWVNSRCLCAARPTLGTVTIRDPRPQVFTEHGDVRLRCRRQIRPLEQARRGVEGQRRVTLQNTPSPWHR